MGEKSNTYGSLMGKSQGKRPTGRRSIKRKDNIKMNLRGIGLSGMDWIHLAQNMGPVEGSCEHGSEFSGSIKCLEILE
jgi:hypothetical protein